MHGGNLPTASPDQWSRVKVICHEALERPSSQRMEFVEKACNRDDQLFHMVQWLLTNRLSAEHFEKTRHEGKGGAGTSSQSRRHPIYWVAAAATPLCLLVYGAAAIAIWHYGGHAQSFGWTAAASGTGLVVASVESGGETDGRLKTGDAILGVSPGVIPPVGYYRRAAPHDLPYRVRIGATQPRDVTLRAPIVRVARIGRLSAIFLSAVTFSAVGVFFGLARPASSLGRALCLAALFTGFGQLFGALDSFSDQLPRAGRFLIGALALFPGILNALLFRATVLLPGPSVPRWIWPGLGMLCYGFGLATVATFGIPSAVLWWSDTDVAAQFLFERTQLLATGATARTSAELLGAASCLLVVVWKLIFVRDVDERRRLRWLFAACIVAAAPFATYKVLQASLISNDPAALRDSWLRIVANGGLTVVPLALAYAVATHRLLDITVVVRRGLQYLLASNALTFSLLLPAIGLTYTMVVNRNQTISETIFENPAYVALIGATVLALWFRGPLRDRLDRMFFREAYDREQVLVGALEQIERVDSITQLSQLVTATLEASLHPKCVYVWYRKLDSRVLSLAHASGEVGTDVEIPSDWGVLRALENNSTILELPLSAKLGVPQHEREWLHLSQVHLLVPLGTADHGLAGVLMLGEKRSEEPYTSRDRSLLSAMARQMGLAWDNQLLKQRVSNHQRIELDVLARLDNANLVKECPQCGECFDAAMTVCATDGHDLTVSLPVERVVDGKYRLDKLIGRGGMAAVYEAHDLRLVRQVALKILPGRAFGDMAALHRFEREARACAALSHANITAIFDYGVIAGGGAYLVMERLHGDTLRAVLRRRGVVAPAIAAEWFDQILEGVKAAHAGGIIHRDLKPENIIIAGQAVKLLDFGLAKIRGTSSTIMESTVAGVVVGTFGYMAPEQLTGSAVDERTDIFALGVMVVEVLTGRRPFDRPSYAELLMAMLHDEFHLSSESADFREIDRIVQRCIASSANARFESVTALQRELIPALRGG